MLDAHQLNVFLTAAETLNFTAAARLLNMTQPSVSQHIQALEQHFKTPLFVRAGRQLSLTDAGRALLPMARKMVSMSVQIDETMVSLQGEVHGHLRVGCSTTSGKYVLPFLLASFLQRHPRVQATCSVTSRQMAVQELCDGQVHLALASPHEFASRDVEFRKFFADPILLIVPLNHPWATCEEIEPEELLDGEFILREEGSGTYEVAARGLAEVGLHIDQLHTILTVGNSEAIAIAVQEGLGVGFVSQFVVKRLVNQRVKEVKVRRLSMYQEVYIGFNRRQPATTAQTAFWEFASNPENPVLLQLAENDMKEILLPDYMEEVLVG